MPVKVWQLLMNAGVAKHKGAEAIPMTMLYFGLWDDRMVRNSRCGKTLISMADCSEHHDGREL